MEKYDAAMDLFIESVIKSDHELRNVARENECLGELLQIREDVLEYLYNIRQKNGTITPGSGLAE